MALPRNSQRESASAAGVPTITEITVVRNATQRLRWSAPRRTLSASSTSYQCRLARSHTTTCRELLNENATSTTIGTQRNR